MGSCATNLISYSRKERRRKQALRKEQIGNTNLLRKRGRTGYVFLLEMGTLHGHKIATPSAPEKQKNIYEHTLGKGKEEMVGRKSKNGEG